MNKLITACIVLYNNDREILLESIISFLNTKLNIELYLVDHSTSNELKDIIRNDKVTYIHNPSNPGFGAGHNFVIKRIIDYSDYHLVLNPDIFYAPGTLEQLIQFMESNNDIGHVMPKILAPSGEFQFLCKKNPTVFDLFARGFMPNFLKSKFKKRLDSYTYKYEDFESVIYDVPYLSGCFMLFRTSVLKNVGLFDEKIFMYLEDADITRRFLEVSRTAYYPGATVYHHYAGLTHKKWKYKWITVQSALVYFNKWGWFESFN